MQKTFQIQNISQTLDLAPEVLRLAQERAQNQAAVVALVGDLGGGKTSFVQGAARALGLKTAIVSPTFILMQSYPLAGKEYPWSTLFHLDSYRAKTAQDFIYLGLPEALRDPSHIVFIEWAERIKEIVPAWAIWMYFFWQDEKRRKIIISDHPLDFNELN